MDDENVLVPPDVYEGLESLQRYGDLDPDDRRQARRAASERGYDHTADWLEEVGDDIYARAARGRFTADREE